MGVNVYKSTDSGAPTLSGTSAGTLITVLKACLVNGYGSKSGAGWTLTLEDTVNKKAMFRNNATTGSGRYFVVRDDGYQYLGQTEVRYSRATIIGAKNYTDIDTLVTPFPRTIVGTNRHSDTFYGTMLVKGWNANTPWIVIADEYTCYLITSKGDATTFNTSFITLSCFGDLVTLANITSHPRAFVAAGMFSNDSSLQYAPCPGAKGSIDGHIENSMINAGESTTFYGLLPDYWVQGTTPLVEAYANGSNGKYIPWISGGSPITGGFVISRIAIAEDPAAPIRSYTHSYPEVEKFAYYPGYYRSAHIIGTDPYKIGDFLDVVHANGRDYLLVPLASYPEPFTNATHCYAFDITGPWR